MKQVLDKTLAGGWESDRLPARTAPRPPCRHLPANGQITPNQPSPDSASNSEVWLFVVLVFLVTAAASYLFWAKISGVWPFG